jgi:hypothetical protein
MAAPGVLLPTELAVEVGLNCEGASAGGRTGGR